MELKDVTVPIVGVSRVICITKITGRPIFQNETIRRIKLSPAHRAGTPLNATFKRRPPSSTAIEWGIDKHIVVSTAIFQNAIKATGEKKTATCTPKQRKATKWGAMEDAGWCALRAMVATSPRALRAINYPWPLGWLPKPLPHLHFPKYSTPDVSPDLKYAGTDYIVLNHVNIHAYVHWEIKRVGKQ
ncbi:hypothetical protein LXL04_023325 [Taraxacum kok-saghyz]